MNPENKPFFNHEEEIDKNKTENKEKKELINFSFASAADLVKQIEEKGYFNKNDYQESCEYAVIHNKNTNKNDFWDLDLEGEKENAPSFYQELPSYFKEANDENLRIFFCVSKYDIPINNMDNEVFVDFEKPAENAGNRTHHCLTPDGIYYQLISKGGLREIIYSEKKRLPIDEVKKIADLVTEKDTNFINGKNFPPYFINFDYESQKDRHK